jgi:hypothetical protein
LVSTFSPRYSISETSYTDASSELNEALLLDNSGMGEITAFGVPAFGDDIPELLAESDKSSYIFSVRYDISER